MQAPGGSDTVRQTARRLRQGGVNAIRGEWMQAGGEAA